MDEKTSKPRVGTATPPPPKKPPSSKTATKTPPNEPPKKPPVGIGITTPEPDRFLGRSAAQKIINRQLSTLSDKDLIAAFKADPFSVLKKFNYFTSPQHQYRLNQLIKKNPRFKPIFETAMSRVKPQILKKLSPKDKPEAPPKVTPEDLIKPLPKTNEINNTNKDAIEHWLNQLKPEFQAYLAKKQREELAERKAMPRRHAAAQAQAFTHNLWQFLSLYRGRIVGHYLSEASYSLIFSALGPIGNMMNLAYRKNYSWKMAWQRNLLNPNAIHYYFNALPGQKAFSLLKYPLTAGFSVLAKAGAPLISTVHYKDYKLDPRKGFVPEIKQKYVFTPLLATIQASNALANKVYQEKNPQYFHQAFNHRLNNLEKAKKDYLSSRIVGDLDTRKKAKQKYEAVNQNLSKLLNTYDGGFDISNISKSFRRHLADNLKSSDRRDPISFLAILLGQLVFDVTIGLVLNTIRIIATKAISLIPGVNALRARFARFLTSRPWMQNIQYAGATGPAFVKGVFSFTTLSSGYLGYQLGGPALAPITGGLGALYKTSLILSKNKALITWVKNFESLQGLAKSPTAARMWALDEMAKLYSEWRPGKWKLGGWTLKPGPLTRFASFLNNKWWLRLPLNGLALGHLFSPFFEQLLGWSPLQSTLALAGADYFWQIKGNLAQSLMKKWLQPSWKILGRSYATPHWKLLSPTNPNSVFSKIRTRYFRRLWLNLAYGEPAGLILKERGWFEAVKRFGEGFAKQFKVAKPFLQNFINPGFFLGFGLGPWLAGFGVPWIPAHIAGALMGTAAWWSAGIIYEVLAGTGPKILSFAQLTASAWTGYWIGLGAQLVLGLFGISAPWLPFIFTMASILLPVLATFATSAGFLGLIGTAAQTILATLALLGPLAAALGTLAFYLSIAVVVVGVFYAIFVMISALWQPSSSTAAVGASECFEIEVTADKTIVNPGDLVTTCATYTVLPNPLLLKDPYIKLEVNADFLTSWDYYATFDENSNMWDGVEAWRQRPTESTLKPLAFSQDQPSYNNLFFIDLYPSRYPPFSQWIDIHLSVLGDDDPITGYHYGGKTIAELSQEFSSLPNILSTAIDKQRQLDILEAQVKTTKKQSEILNSLLSSLDSTLTLLSRTGSNSISSELQPILDNFSTLLTLDINNSNHPFYDQIQAAQAQLDSCGSDQDCRNHFQNLINTYQLWKKTIQPVATLINGLTILAAAAETANPANPDYSKLKADFETLVNTIIPTLLDTLKTSQDDLESNIDQINKFDPSQEFYYAEGNTVYKVCWQATFSGEAGQTISQTAEVSFSQPGGLITQYTCQTQNTVIFNP